MSRSTNRTSECDILPVDKMQDFSAYDVLIIAPLYVATDSIENPATVKPGWLSGDVLQTDVTTTTMRAMLAPGPLSGACGFHYQNIPASTSCSWNQTISKRPPTTGEHVDGISPAHHCQTACSVDHQFSANGRASQKKMLMALYIYGTVPSRDILNKLSQWTAKRISVGRTYLSSCVRE